MPQNSGSHGTLLTAVPKKNLGTSGIVIDLPNVADRARQALQANGLGDRAEAIGGDFFVDVPEGDVYLLKQILHDWNDDQCRAILANCARRLAYDQPERATARKMRGTSQKRCKVPRSRDRSRVPFMLMSFAVTIP